MKRPVSRLRLLLALAVVSVLAAACADGGGKKPVAGPSGSACTAGGDERAAKAILRCTESSVAFLETDVASGTGIVVGVKNNRYVLTNEHVVDPFDAADATIEGRTYENLRVVGVDIASDIALLGPLTGGRLPEPLTIADGTGLERGDEVFLVGFPGESSSEDLEATIASGIVSRLREAKEFGQSFIQTDASIAGGQSGGPLFDAQARVVGISGLGFAEEFALALTGRDVKEAMDRIIGGDGDDYLSLPAPGSRAKGSTGGLLEIYDASDGQILFLPASPRARTWHLTVDMAANPTISVTNFADEEVLAVSGNTDDVAAEVTRQLTKARGVREEDLPEPPVAEDPKVADRETAPGTFTIPVKAYDSALVYVFTPLTDAPLRVPWQSDLPLVVASRPVSVETIEVGEHVDATFGPFDTAVDVLVDLEKGRKVELHARSPQGNPSFDVFGPNRKLDHLTMADTVGADIPRYDDTDDGLFGVDAKTTFEAETSGTYRFRIYSNDFTTIWARFSVKDCAKVRCGKRSDRG